MANVNENLLVRGARGHVGKQFVYKKHGESTNLVRMPTINKDAVPTDNQAVKRESCFQKQPSMRRTRLVRQISKRSTTKKATPGKNAYNIAFRDYLKPPVVKKHRCVEIQGPVGSVIVDQGKRRFPRGGGGGEHSHCSGCAHRRRQRGA